MTETLIWRVFYTFRVTFRKCHEIIQPVQCTPLVFVMYLIHPISICWGCEAADSILQSRTLFPYRVRLVNLLLRHPQPQKYVVRAQWKLTHFGFYNHTLLLTEWFFHNAHNISWVLMTPTLSHGTKYNIIRCTTWDRLLNFSTETKVLEHLYRTIAFTSRCILRVISNSSWPVHH